MYVSRNPAISTTLYLLVPSVIVRRHIPRTRPVPSNLVRISRRVDLDSRILRVRRTRCRKIEICLDNAAGSPWNVEVGDAETTWGAIAVIATLI